MADLITRPDHRAELAPLADSVGERLLTTQSPQRPQSTPRIRIEVDGKVQGDMHAKKSVKVSNSAIVRGNIRAPSVSITEGANFNGSVSMEPSVGTQQATAGAPAGFLESLVKTEDWRGTDSWRFLLGTLVQVFSSGSGLAWPCRGVILSRC